MSYRQGYIDGLRDAGAIRLSWGVSESDLAVYRKQLLQWHEDERSAVPTWWDGHIAYHDVLDVGEANLWLYDRDAQAIPIASLLPGQEEVDLRKVFSNSEEYRHLMSPEDVQFAEENVNIEGPIIVKEDGPGEWIVVDGHHRVTAAILDGDKEVHAVVLDWDQIDGWREEEEEELAAMGIS